MNIIALETFIAIVETGSLVRASEHMNVTQSTVTARLRTLEDSLGQKLIFRHKSGATLTPAGTKLMGYAEIMVGLWRQAKYETGLPRDTVSVCNFGCHIDLWPGPGKAFFQAVNDSQGTMALTAWQGGHDKLNQWLRSGLVDVIITYEPSVQGNQTVHALPADDIFLYATEADRPMRFDPNYIFVDQGEEFRKQHAAAYADADTARITFGVAIWALEYLLANGGSAYLPKRLAVPYLETSRLSAILGAPSFQRNTYLVVNDTTAKSWPWLPHLLNDLFYSVDTVKYEMQKI